MDKGRFDYSNESLVKLGIDMNKKVATLGCEKTNLKLIFNEAVSFAWMSSDCLKSTKMNFSVSLFNFWTFIFIWN